MQVQRKGFVVLPFLILCFASIAGHAQYDSESKVTLPDFTPKLGDVYPFEPPNPLSRQYTITVPDEERIIDTRLEEMFGFAIVLPDLKKEIIFQCWVNVTCCISTELSGCTDFVFACDTNNGVPTTHDGGQTASCTY